MPKISELEQLERVRDGQALRTLRRRAGLTQEDAAHAADNISHPAWKNYERGIRRMDRVTLERAMTAIGAEVEDFERERNNLVPASHRAPTTPASDTPRPTISVIGTANRKIGTGFEPELMDMTRFLNSDTRALRLGDMSMSPWAEPGTIITYNVNHPPRRGQGCVVELNDGTFRVRLFEMMDENELTLTALYPSQSRETIAIGSIAGAYSISLRCD